MGILAHNNKIIIAPNGKALTPPQGWGLPAEYQEVEYIKSHGTEYLDSGFVLMPDDVVSIVYESEKAPSDPFEGLIGVSESENLHSTLIYFGTGYVAYRFNGAAVDPAKYIYLSDTYINQKLTYEFKKSEYIKFGEYYQESGFTPDNDERSFYILARRVGSSVDGIAKGKLYRITIERDDDIIVADLVPCYDQDTDVVGLYDIITRRFLTNIGTGAFEKGPNILSSNQILSRLEAIL